MASDNHCILIEAVDALTDGFFNLVKISTGQIGTTNAALEQGIAGNQGFVFIKPETD